MSWRIQQSLLKVFVMVFPVALIAISAGMIAHALDLRRVATDSNDWPTVTGVIRTSNAVEEYTNRRDYYVPRVSYTYVVDGEILTGSRLRADELQFEQEASAEQRLAPYPVGAQVTVRYNPDDPREAVLEPGGGSEWILFASGGIASILVTVAVAIKLIRDEIQDRRRRERGRSANAKR